MNDDFAPTASLQHLERRARLLKDLRRFFDDRGFIEVETPILSNDVVVDRYLEPISVAYSDVTSGSSDTSRRLWMQTSPEFGMKRLLACGAKSIYQITRAFRAGEQGQFHNPEFTMLEWYRVGDEMQAGMKLLADLATATLKCNNVKLQTYQETFEEHAGINPHRFDLPSWVALASKHGIELAESAIETDIDFWRNLILTHLVEPKLGQSEPVIVYDWPATQSALAVVRDELPPVAERFELYFKGVELANGYHELLDANELLKRNRQVNEHRKCEGRSQLPNESRLLNAMRAGLPNCSGVALGVDRLAMLVMGVQSIADVIAFPIDIA